jgi:hypothetical protein
MTDLRLVASNQLPSLTISTRPKPPSTLLTSPVTLPMARPPGFEPSRRLYLHANLNTLLTLQPECEGQIASLISRMLAAAERIDAERKDASKGPAEADRQVLFSGR